MKKIVFVFCIAVYLIFVTSVITSAYASSLPKVVACTSYGVGVAGHTVASGLGEAISKLTPMQWRVEPYGTDIERLAPLKYQESEFSLTTSVTAFLASSGLDEFGAAEWGPQPVRIACMGSVVIPGLYVRADSGIKTVADLKGKRLPDIKGTSTVMREIEAILAFAGLTWKDVKLVPVGGFGASMQAVLDGDIDAALGSIFSPKIKELASGPHGCRFLEMPASDKEGWKRVQNMVPAMFPATQKKVPGLEKDVELFGVSYSLYCYPWVQDEVVYTVIKAVAEGYDFFKSAHPWLSQWKLENMVRNIGGMPFHPGSVKFFKEAGTWTDALEAYQEKELAAEKVRTSK